MDVCVPAVLPHRRYSSTIATLFTALLSAALFGHSLTLNFCIGVSIVGISMHQFFSQGPPPPAPPPPPVRAQSVASGRPQRPLTHRCRLPAIRVCSLPTNTHHMYCVRSFFSL